MSFEIDTARAAPAPVRAERFSGLLRLSISAHAPLLLLALAYLAVFNAASLFEPRMIASDGAEVILSVLFFSVPAFLFGLVTLTFIELAAVVKPEHPISALFGALKRLFSDPERMAAAIPAALALAVFMYVFTMVKASISVLVPFSWDRSFDHLDTLLHFGYRPWQLLQPVFGWWPVTFLVNLNYNMWFVVMSVFWAWYAFRAEPGPQRTRFFLSYMLIWMVGGGLLAVAFSSAGPCYFTRLGISPDPYAPLMAYLNDANTHAPIWALMTQDMLWDLKLQGSGFGGVSAMPSMHNATALLFVLMCPWRSVVLRRLLMAHAALIFLGSIHLGWHYAVDGYAAWALALAVWAGTKPFARWWHAQEPSRRFNHALR